MQNTNRCADRVDSVFALSPLHEDSLAPPSQRHTKPSTTTIKTKPGIDPAKAELAMQQLGKLFQEVDIPISTFF
jgi:hypothetical protein